jgi:hypothetical protein
MPKFNNKTSLGYGNDVAMSSIQKLYPDVEKSNFYTSTGTRGMKVTHHIGVRLRGEVHHYEYEPKTGAIIGKKQVMDWKKN